MLKTKEKYNQEAVAVLREKFGYKNVMQVPRIEKVVVNVGTGQGLKDASFNENVEETLKRITGQKPVKTTARKSISNFKIRGGQVVGMMCNLRGNRMYDFIDKLVHVTFPRVRDFRGISEKSVDSKGNLNLGFKEHLAFPEIHSDEVERIHGLQVTIVTTAKNREEGLELFRLLGFPFSKEKK